VDNALATQLITVGATLGGVVLTLVGSALVERRRAREAHQLESLRLAAEHTKWLRDERMKAYAAFSLAGEDMHRFLRAGRLDAGRWPEVRADLRKAYNQVQLLGAEEPRMAAVSMWRLAAATSNDQLVELASGEDAEEWVDQVAELRNEFGDESNAFLQACRADLQGG
jgi:hypothetical protein